jgi:hypothetical protein
MSSPWGRIDQVEKITVGISFVSTPSHGGLRVSKRALNKYAINPELITKLGGIEISNYVFFEEDCAQFLFLLDAPEILKLDALKRGLNPDDMFQTAKKIVENWIPDYFK